MQPQLENALNDDKDIGDNDDLMDDDEDIGDGDNLMDDDEDIVVDVLEEMTFGPDDDIPPYESD